ncbi:hypothetical protein CR513_51440, partial [Mucuna pruriens]
MVAKVCGICTSVEHPTDMCPTLQETESDQPEHVGAVGGFQLATRTICSSKSRPCPEYASGISRLPIAESTIPSTTFPTAVVAVEGAYSRQLSISGGPNKAARN